MKRGTLELVMICILFAAFCFFVVSGGAVRAFLAGPITGLAPMNFPAPLEGAPARPSAGRDTTASGAGARPGSPARQRQEALAQGRQLTKWLYSSQLEQLWSAFSPSVRAQWGSLSAFQAYRRGGLEAYGAETKVVRERVSRSAGITYYIREAVFERGPRSGWTLIFGLDHQGQVKEFGIVDASVLPAG